MKFVKIIYYYSILFIRVLTRARELVQVPEHVERHGAVLDGREGGGAHVRLDLCYFADSE